MPDRLREERTLLHNTQRLHGSAEQTLAERLVMHEKLCFAMVLALGRDTEEAHAATVKVLESREKLLRDWATTSVPTGDTDG